MQLLVKQRQHGTGSLSSCCSGGKLGVEVGVELVDLLLVDLFAHVALQFEGGRKDIVRRRELLVGDVKRLGLLETVELTECAQLVDLFHQKFDEVCVLGLEDGGHVLAVILAPLAKSVLAGHEDGDADGLERVPVHHDLLNVVRLHQDILDLFGRHILTLRQLENVLASIQDLNSSVRIDDTNIASVEVALRIDGLSSLVRAHEVAWCYTRAANADLTARVRLVSDAVVHFGKIFELDGRVLDRAANSARDWVVDVGDSDSSTRLREPIGLHHWARERNLHHLEHVFRNGCGGGDHAANATAE